LLLEVDGGVNLKTIAECTRAGAQLLVVGSAIFGQEDYRSAVQRLIGAMDR
jgi:ribulose-phosphate 3-epimerase